MLSEEEYLQLKKKIKAKEQEIDRIKGKEESLMDQLRKDFGCKTLAAAKKKLKQLEKQAEEQEQEFQKQYDELVENWGDELGIE